MKRFLFGMAIGVAIVALLALVPGCTQKTAQTPLNPEVVSGPDIGPRTPSKAESFDHAISLAKQHNKKVLLIISADWCRPCQTMKREVWPDSAVKAKLKNFIVYNVDFDSQKPLVKKYYVRNIPAYVIVDTDKEPLRLGTGQRSVSEILRWLE